MLYRMLKRLIELGKTEGLEQYNELIELLKNETIKVEK